MYGISISDPIVSETLFPVYIDLKQEEKFLKHVPVISLITQKKCLKILKDILIGLLT